MRIALEEIAGSVPEHEGVDGGVGEIQSQFMNQRRGEQGVADARERNDQNLHGWRKGLPTDEFLARGSCRDQNGGKRCKEILLTRRNGAIWERFRQWEALSDEFKLD